jgi:hypothetical protein
LNQDTSLDLFDIDENDFETEYDNSREDVLERDESDDNDLVYDPNFSGGEHSNSNTYGYTNYSLPSFPPQYFTSQGQNLFADPFQGQGLSSIAESVEHHFQMQHAPANNNNNNIYLGLGQDISRAPHQPPIPLLDASFRLGPAPMRGYTGGPAWVPVPASIPSLAPTSVNASGKKEPDVVKPQETGCSVCLASHPRTLAVLIPCEHPLCSACLTSALNIVGEKDMECAVCRGKVEDFKLVVSDGSKNDNAQSLRSDNGGNKSDNLTLSGQSFMEPLFSSPESGTSRDGLESAFEFGLGLDEVRASTPKLRDEPNQQATFRRSEDQILQDTEKKIRERGRGRGKTEENVVLRIDNVPWVRSRLFCILFWSREYNGTNFILHLGFIQDITPPQINKWLQQPIERVHVLLDAKGKTMSHAYVEVGDAVVAGRILRGEGGGLDGAANDDGNEGGKKTIKSRERGSVLGKGRRARGVTITRTGQEELMSDVSVSPFWFHFIATLLFSATLSSSLPTSGPDLVAARIFFCFYLPRASRARPI